MVNILTLMALVYVRGVLWFVGRPISSQALGYEARRCERILGRKKNQKSIRQYFKISAKKTILDLATVEYQLNDSFFLQFQ